jgi:hypothetical protein
MGIVLSHVYGVDFMIFGKFQEIVGSLVAVGI